MKRLLVTGGCGKIGSKIAVSAMPFYEVDVIDDLSSGDLSNLGSRSDFRTCPVAMVENFPDEKRSEMILAITGDFADPRILSRIRSGYYESVVHSAFFSGSADSFPIENFENENYKTIALIWSCFASTSYLVLNQRETSDRISQINNEIIDAYLNHPRLSKLNFGKVIYSVEQIYEQDLMNRYIEDVAYANLSLCKSLVSKREFVLK